MTYILLPHPAKFEAFLQLKNEEPWVNLEEGWRKGSDFAQQTAKIQAIVAETL